MVNNKRIYFKLLALFALACFCLILLLNVYTFYNGGDDYYFISDLQKVGVLQNCINGYNNWDGRYLALGAFVQGMSLLYLPIELATFFWNLAFLSSGIILYYVIQLESQKPHLVFNLKPILLFVFPILLWIGSYKHIAETIYWGTGGVYSFDLLLGAIWVIGFLKFQKNNYNLILKIIFILFSLIVGASTQNLAIALITLVLISIIIDFLKNNNSKASFNLLLLLILIIGLLFITLAPGNQLRINEVKKIAKPDLTLLYFAENFARTLFLYLKWSLVLIILSIFSSFAISFSSEGEVFFYNLEINLKTKTGWADLIADFKWLLVAISTITPFLTIPEVVSPRTAIYFMFFIMIFVILFTSKIIRPAERIIVRDNYWFSKLLFFILILGIFVFASSNFISGKALKKEVLAREIILKKGRNKTVYIKPINPNLNSVCFKFSDFVNDGTESVASILENQERFFGTKIVIVK
jgi:hypothetical protein